MGGIVDFVKFLNDGKETLNKPIYFEAETPTDRGSGPAVVQLLFHELRHGLRQQHQHP